MASFTATEGLEIAKEIEKSGEVFYNEAAAASNDDELKALFKDLAVQERGHHRVFQEMLEDSTPSLSAPVVDYDQYQMYLQVTLENALFEGPDKARTLAKQAKNRESALRAAMNFEKDTLLFFYDLRDMVSEADQDAVTKIIVEEKKHLRRLMEMF